MMATMLSLSSVSSTARHPRRDASPSPRFRQTSPDPVSRPLLQKKSSCACGGGCPRCQSKLPIQTKLSVSHPGDVYEQEADRVADQIMRTPAPALQRKCASCTAGGRTCPKCAAEEKNLVQRKAPPPAANESGVSVSENFLGDLGPGEPLDAAARNFFEPRFGQDFSRVRVHTDARAAESAAAVNASAYTIGKEIAFGRNQYAPSSDAGQRLLAHELAHTIQQRGSQSVRRQRASGSATTVTVQATGNCSVAQGSALTAAVTTAIQWLHTAIQSLHWYEALPLSRSTAAVRTALQFHFHTTNPFHAALIRTRLAQVRDGLEGPQGAPSDCAASGDTGCGSATTAYQQRGRVVWCPYMFASDRTPNDQARTVVHEYTHAHARRLPLAAGFAEFSDRTPRRIEDRAYLDRRYYLDLTPEEAMDNAPSYANLVQDLGTGTAVTQAPSERAQDRMPGCSPAQQELVRQSLSMVARWNDATEATLNDTSLARYPTLDRLVTDAIRNRFGTPPPARRQLAAVYEAVSTPLLLGLALACDGATGNCRSSASYLWQSGSRGTIHVCPGWIAESDSLKRHRTIYSSVLGNTGLRRGNPWSYVDLARDLEGLHLGTPELPPPLPAEPFPESTVPGTEIA